MEKVSETVPDKSAEIEPSDGLKETLQKLFRAGVISVGVFAANAAFANELAQTEPPETPPDEMTVEIPFELLPEDAIQPPPHLMQTADVETLRDELDARTALENQQIKAVEQDRVHARIEQGFTNEEELMQFYSDMAREGKFEHVVIYGITQTGELKIFFHDIGDSMWYGVSQEDSRIDKPRAQHVTALRLLHTHTAHAAEERKSEGLFDAKTDPLETVLPFSSADLNTAITMGWLNRYDDVSLWRDSIPGACTYDNIVVDPTGVWTYSVDPTHPYIHEIMQRKLDMVLDSSDAKTLLTKYPDLSKEKLAEMIRTLASPDSFVRARAENGIKQYSPSQQDSIISLSEQYTLNSLYNKTRINFIINKCTQSKYNINC